MADATHDDSSDDLPFDPARLTQQECSEMFGVTTRTLRDWETFSRNAEPGVVGPFPRNADGTYHMHGMICWFLLYSRRKRR